MLDIQKISLKENSVFDIKLRSSLNGEKIFLTPGLDIKQNQMSWPNIIDDDGIGNVLDGTLPKNTVGWFEKKVQILLEFFLLL